jgi:hypothetical protein
MKKKYILIPLSSNSKTVNEMDKTCFRSKEAFSVLEMILVLISQFHVDIYSSSRWKLRYLDYSLNNLTDQYFFTFA